MLSPARCMYLGAFDRFGVEAGERRFYRRSRNCRRAANRSFQHRGLVMRVRARLRRRLEHRGLMMRVRARLRRRLEHRGLVIRLAMGFGWWLQHRGFRIVQGEFGRGLRNAGLVLRLGVGFSRRLQDAPLLAGLPKGFVGSSFDQSESALGAEPDVVRVFGSARCAKHRRSQPFRFGMVTVPCKAPAASIRTARPCPGCGLSRSPPGLAGTYE